MRSARRLLVVLGLAAAAGGIGLGVAASPAAADDCSRRLKEAGYFEGITDEAVVEDCLRTGGNFGRVVGVVVGVTGVVIAAAGLPGSKGTGATATTSTPSLAECMQAMDTRDAIDQSLADLEREQERIGREWEAQRQRAAAFGAAFQAQLANRHRQSEWAVNSMIGRNVTSAAIGGLIGQAMALVAGTSVGVAGTAEALTGVQAARGAGGALLGGGLTFGADAWNRGDMLGTQHLYNRLVEIWSGWPRWIERAEELNREMEDWHRDRTDALRKRQADIAQSTQAYSALVPGCTRHLADLETSASSFGNEARALLRRMRSQIDNPLPTSFADPEIPRLVIRPWLEFPGIAGTRFGVTPGYLQTMNMSKEIARRVGAVTRFEATSAGARFPGSGLASFGNFWQHQPGMPYWKL